MNAVTFDRSAGRIQLEQIDFRTHCPQCGAQIALGTSSGDLLIVKQRAVLLQAGRVTVPCSQCRTIITIDMDTPARAQPV